MADVDNNVWNVCPPQGGKIYGGSYNEPEAYLYFCRAALEYLLRSGRNPNVLHIHEWQASAAGADTSLL